MHKRTQVSKIVFSLFLSLFLSSSQSFRWMGLRRQALSWYQWWECGSCTLQSALRLRWFQMNSAEQRWPRWTELHSWMGSLHYPPLPTTGCNPLHRYCWCLSQVVPLRLDRHNQCTWHCQKLSVPLSMCWNLVGNTGRCQTIEGPWEPREPLVSKSLQSLALFHECTQPFLPHSCIGPGMGVRGGWLRGGEGKGGKDKQKEWGVEEREGWWCW